MESCNNFVFANHFSCRDHDGCYSISDSEFVEFTATLTSGTRKFAQFLLIRGKE